MRTFTTADLNKQVGEVTSAASKGPVTITWRRKPRFVIMSYEHYKRISEQADPRRVYGAGETPDELGAPFAGALDRLATGEGDDDEP
jgi:prevent-host-death family protein